MHDHGEVHALPVVIGNPLSMLTGVQL